MKTTSLKLLFSIVLIFTVTDCDILNDLKNCSLTSGRLSNNKVTPIKYDIQLKIRPNAKKIYGKTNITIYVKEQTLNISLHARDIKVHFAWVKTIRYNAEPEAICKLEKMINCTEDDILILIFDNVIPFGYNTLFIEHYSLFTEYLSKFTYPDIYNGTRPKQKWLFTNLYVSSHSIRGLFPSWDDLAINKATFNVSVQHDANVKIFFNTPIQKTSIDVKEFNLQLTQFQETRPMSTHFLVIAIVSDIVNHSAQNKFHYLWHKPNMVKEFQYTNTIIQNVTTSLYWHINIIWSRITDKIDYVAFPNSPMKSAGKPGLIIYREKDITYNKHSDSNGKRINIAKLISYEMVRQLFAYISIGLTKNRWLNEIFSSFYSYYSLYKIWGDEIIQLFVVQNLQTTLDSEVSLEQESIMHRAKEDVGIDGLLYPLLYHKKAFALIRMFFHLTTLPKFYRIIITYVYSHFGSNPTHYDFWDILHTEYPEHGTYTTKQIMESWLTEKHHPEMLFIRDYNKNTVMFRQTFSSKISKSKIPLTYTTMANITSFHENMERVIWYEGTYTAILDGPDSDHFFIANLEQVGYYRVNYDNRNWLLLSDYLQSRSYVYIPVLNRAQIVNDAFHFVTIYDLEPAIFYDVIQFLRKDTNFIVWYPMFNILSYMSTYLEMSTSKVAKINFLNILNGILPNIALEEQQSDISMTNSFKLLIIKWACEFGHIGCRYAIASKIKPLINNISNSSRISLWANWIYCTGIMTLSRIEWEVAWLNGINQENLKILEYLSCSENERIILDYLEKILKSNFEWETELYGKKIYLSIVKKHVRKDAVLNYVLYNYDKAVERFFNNVDDSIPMCNIIMNVHSKEHLDQISLFTTKKFLSDQSFIIHKCILERRKQITRVINKFRMF